MQQFTVPQFIDVENKIIGPITTRQFLILLAAAVIIGLSYRLFDFSLFILIAFVVLILAGTFAFVKINGRPFHLFMVNIIQTWKRPNLRVWKKVIDETPVSETAPAAPQVPKYQPKEFYGESRLSQLALVVDTKGKYKGE